LSPETKAVVPSPTPAAELQSPGAIVQAGAEPTALNGVYLKAATSKPGHNRRLLYAGALVVVAAIGAAYWFMHRPPVVTTIRPVMTSVNETIASSGLAAGVKESVIGASFNGAVLRLLVKLGDHVVTGQTLAVLKNDITQAQVRQAEAAVVTAQSLLIQASRGPLASELQVNRMQVTQARALATEANSELDLARKTQTRTQALSKAGVISRSDMDTSVSALAAAEAKARSGSASIRLAEAQLQTLQATPRKEAVELARDRLTEAKQALLVVRQQAEEAIVIAPYSGTITAVNVEVGQNVDAVGLFNLVSDALEIRIDLDESNLADLSLGQKALLSATAFPGESFEGKLKEISPSVNKIRGTVSIKLEPLSPPAWLKSGQTLNVNLVTNQAAQRLLVPATALRKSGERTVALVVDGDRAIEKIVLTRPPTSNGIPVMAGLEASDLVIVNPQRIQSGEIVRIKN
jgi:HlyD family secretion protein